MNTSPAKKLRAISLQGDKLPTLNRSTAKYSLDPQGKQICNHHVFCTHQYELNDQSNILKALSQPLSSFNGAQLPPPKDFDIGSSSKHLKQRLGSRDSVDSQTQAKKNFNSTPINKGGITEEALDDWIAQSQNRPIISFLDPYKKFNVPEQLLSDLRVRYKKWMVTKEKDFEKKLLYFEDRSKISQIPHYQLPTRRPKEAEKTLTYRFKELQPHNIDGTSIQVRENSKWNHITKKVKQEMIQFEQSIEEESLNLSSFKNKKSHYLLNKRQEVRENVEKKVPRCFSSQIYRRAKSNYDKPSQEQNSSYLNISNETQHKEQRANQDNVSILKYINDKSEKADVSLSPKRGGSSKLGEGGERQVSMSMDNYLKVINKESQLEESAKNNSNLSKSNVEDDILKADLAVRVNELLKLEDEMNKKTKNSFLLKHASSEANNLNVSNRHQSFIKHESCILEVPQVEKNQLTEVEFSFWKGVRRIQKLSFFPAISCLKEALSYDLLYFKAIFNLGCLYEQIGNYSQSISWLQISLSFGKNLPQVHYALALSYYHLNQFEDSLQHLENALNGQQHDDDEEEENSNHLTIKEKEAAHNKHVKQMEQKYLRALCLKQLNKEEESGREYQKFLVQTCPKNFKLLMILMISLALKKRRELEIKIQPRILCEFQNLVSEILAPNNYSPVLQPYWDDNQWIDVSFLLKRLKLQSFFSRFDEGELKRIIQFAKFQIVAKQNVIFPQKHSVFVITAGTVILQKHLQTIQLPDTIAYFSEGDIIGLPEKDGGISAFQEIWFNCLTEVEILSFPREEFLEIWKKHSQNENKMKILNQISQSSLFKGVSELTLHKIAFEMIEVVKFQEGETIFNDGESVEHIKGIQLKKPEKVNQKMNPSDKSAFKKKQEFQLRKIRGIYIIKSGVCELDTLNNWADYKLLENDYFGENLLFEVTSVNKFGRIRAKSPQVFCYLLPTTYFSKISSLDCQIMQVNAQNSHKQGDYKLLNSNFVKEMS